MQTFSKIYFIAIYHTNHEAMDRLRIRHVELNYYDKFAVKNG